MTPFPALSRRSAVVRRVLARGRFAFVVVLTAFAGIACSGPVHAAVDLPAPEVDLTAAPAAEGEAARAEVVLAGGCFWCTEAVFEELAGVTDVVSGYSGGHKDEADYQQVSAGLTNHAESIHVTYDPTVISYGTLLRVFFSVAHNPTQVDRQGNDIGRQYRSAIFYADADQKQVAQAYIDQLNSAGVFDKPIATHLEPLSHFYPAEEYHQNYARLNPSQGYIRAVAMPKVAHLHEMFPELLKPGTTE